MFERPQISTSQLTTVAGVAGASETHSIPTKAVVHSVVEKPRGTVKPGGSTPPATPATPASSTARDQTPFAADTEACAAVPHAYPPGDVSGPGFSSERVSSAALMADSAPRVRALEQELRRQRADAERVSEHDRRRYEEAMEQARQASVVRLAGTAVAARGLTGVSVG